MKKNKSLIILSALLSISNISNAAVSEYYQSVEEIEAGYVERTKAIRIKLLDIYGDERRDELVKGAQHIDWFLPIPEGKVTSKTWGDVVPRNVDNGLEDDGYSYWGGNIVLGDDGKYHMFACRWKENTIKNKNAKGHMAWWSSTVTHSISDNPEGPYTVICDVGHGHNPEIYRRKDGSYAVATMSNAYSAKTLDGPWVKEPLNFKYIDKKRNQSNRTYIVRNDGSLFLLTKEGNLFVSESGLEDFTELDVPAVYRRVYTNKGTSGEEDPVMWKDEVNYNIIVNSPYIPEAYLFTSADGMAWKREEGVAYTNRVVKHKDGTVEKWRWMERPKVLTDKYGRVTHMNFAAIDTLKGKDLPNDNHSSKNVVVPMEVYKRLQLIGSKDADILKIKILSEDGFDAIKDVDVKSLKFGNFTAVNFGGGAKALKAYPEGKDLVVEFKNADTKLTSEDYKAKMLGKLKGKKDMWGKVRLTPLPKVY